MWLTIFVDMDISDFIIILQALHQHRVPWHPPSLLILLFLVKSEAAIAELELIFTSADVYLHLHLWTRNLENLELKTSK